MNPRLPCGLLLLCAVLACSALRAAEPLIRNGDFELADSAAPPPGWAMWGAQEYKNPANYTRDTTNPHGGQGCFRIYHPAGTSGYIVSHPDYAVPAQPGMMLTVTFWARTDRPGPSRFLLTAYESINPYRDAPSAGDTILAVDRDWKKFSFTVYEGWDYFADQSRLILLTFIPTADRALEKTLWIDDVTVTQEPSTRAGRILNERDLRYEPLQHRLKPGETLEFTVDAGRPLRPTSREVGGVSFHRVVGWTGEPYNKAGQYTLNAEVEQAIAALNLPLTRFYGVGDEPFGLETAIERVVELVGKVGIPQEKTVLELETQGATSKLAPEVWARAVRYCKQKGYRFRYWEVSNEPWIRRGDGVFTTPEEYVAHVKAVAAALKGVDPGVQIGISITNEQSWGNRVLKQAAGSYDFAVGHYYAVSNVMGRKFEPVVLSENYKTLDRILRFNALLQAYNPGREVYQLDTEWGMISSGPKGEEADYVDRNANIVGVVHRAVRLIYYAREGMLRGASCWQMLNRLNAQGFGILAQQAPQKRFMLYWLYYYFNRHLGELALNPEGTAPFYSPGAGEDGQLQTGSYPGPLTPVLVTLRADRKWMYAVIANGSWDKVVPCKMTWSGFRARGAEAYVLSNDNLDAKPLLDKDDDLVTLAAPPTTETGLSYQVPPHSVTFIAIESR